MKPVSVGCRVTVLASAICAGLVAQELLVQCSNDQIQVAAPKFHFLMGEPLQRMRNGNSVPFDFQLTILETSKTAILRRSFERFVLSYDLWEEKYSVARMRSTRAHASHLSAVAAESWCLGAMSFPANGLPMDQPLWVRLEVHAQDPTEPALLKDDEGVSISSLIAIFSRANHSKKAAYWRLEQGPVTLGALARSGHGAD